jgi:hypothetical protein
MQSTQVFFFFPFFQIIIILILSELLYLFDKHALNSFRRDFLLLYIFLSTLFPVSSLYPN